MRQDTYHYEYVLDDDFFKNIDAPDIRKGQLHVDLDIKKYTGGFILDFHTEGIVTVPCDRCLDDMELSVDTENTLKVKLGADFADEEDFVTIPEEEGYIDISWFLYEFIALSLPMQHIHATGECNQKMMDVLNRHMCTEGGETSEGIQLEDEADRESIDPRWNELKKILDNN